VKEREIREKEKKDREIERERKKDGLSFKVLSVTLSRQSRLRMESRGRRGGHISHPDWLLGTEP
jgi:hypothetical protein